MSSRIKEDKKGGLWELQALSPVCGGAAQTLVRGLNCQCFSARDKFFRKLFLKAAQTLPVPVGPSLFLPAALHHGLVLAHPQPPSLHYAGPFGSGFVFVIGVALQMLPAQPRLLFVVRLLLLVRHGFPPRAYRQRRIDTKEWVHVLQQQKLSWLAMFHFLWGFWSICPVFYVPASTCCLTLVIIFPCTPFVILLPFCLPSFVIISPALIVPPVPN